MLEQLIQNGEDIKSRNVKDSVNGKYITGEEYAKWIYDCIIYLENKYQGRTFTLDFIKESKDAVGSSIKHYEMMIAILKSVKDGVDNGFLD